MYDGISTLFDWTLYARLCSTTVKTKCEQSWLRILETYASWQTSNCFCSNLIKPSFTVTSAEAPSCNIDSFLGTPGTAEIRADLDDLQRFPYGSDRELLSRFWGVRGDG